MFLDDIALRRLRVLTVPSGDPAGIPSGTSESASSGAAGLMALSDLVGLGYRVTNLDEWDDRLLARWAHTIVPALVALRGGDVDYAPLFPGFPDQIPDHRHAVIRDAILVVQPWVPTWFLDLLIERLGIEATKSVRVSSVPQDPKQKKRVLEAQAQRPADTHTEWIDLTIASEDDAEKRLRAWMEQLLYAPTSIKDAEIPDVLGLLTHFGIDTIDIDRVVFLETKSMLFQTMWEVNAFDELEIAGPSPTDILRIFARLTGTDVSLMKQVRFPRMSKRQRRLVLACIDQNAARVDQLFQYRNLWLRIAEYLHPGQYRRRYPKAAEAFDELRAERRNKNSLGSRCEALLHTATTETMQDFGLLLGDHPTVFARRLRHALISAPDPQAVLAQFQDVSDNVPAKVLLTLRKHIATVNSNPKRAVINRGGGVRVIASPPPLDGDLTKQALEVLNAAISRRLGAAPSWAGETVWIDPRLADYVAPFQQRKVSDGLLNVARGTRLPLGDQPVLRLFVYWQEPLGQRSDLDLSAVTFDADMNFIGQVSWTKLTGAGITHSGDITSAPVGASEFIDIRLDSLGRDVRYVAPQIYRYAGPPFNGLIRAHAGWMIRSRDGYYDDDAKTFDIKTVQNVFDLLGRSAYAVPFVADIRSREVIYTDLYVGSRQMQNRVESSASTVAEICDAVRHFSTNRVTIEDLATSNARARGAEVASERARASITIGLDQDCTIRANDVAKVNAELLA